MLFSILILITFLVHSKLNEFKLKRKNIYIYASLFQKSFSLKKNNNKFDFHIFFFTKKSVLIAVMGKPTKLRGTHCVPVFSRGRQIYSTLPITS